jgi:hypothetical protein
MSDVAELYGLGWSAPSLYDLDEFGDWTEGLHPRGHGGKFATAVAKVQAKHPGVELRVGHSGGDTARVSLIRTPESQRGKGLAGAAMRDLTKAADEHGVRLTLTPEPLAGDRKTSKAKLAAWYKTHGFVENKGRNKDYEISDTMHRAPRSLTAASKQRIEDPESPKVHTGWSPARPNWADLYAQVDHDPGGFYSQPAMAHWTCDVGEFCRNPLHPGPCKGWKHMLHSVAPGAYHAYEKGRVAKLNEQRKAKIAALEALGQPVPAYLKKEVTYAQVPKAPAGYSPPFTPSAEALKAIPTKAEIGAELDKKHAAIAVTQKAAHADKQHLALINSAKALGYPIGSSEKAKIKFHEIAANLKPGEKISDQPLIATAIDQLATRAEEILAKNGQGSTPGLHKVIAQDIAAHVDAGIPEPPLTVQSVLNAKPAAHVPHNDMQHAAAVAGLVTGSPHHGVSVGHQHSAYDSPNVNKQEYDKLKPVEQKNVKDHLVAMYDSAPGQTTSAAAKLGIPMMEILDPTGMGAPGKPKSIEAQQVMQAISDPGKSAAQRLAAYEGLTKDSLAELPEGYQKSLKGDLQEMIDKGGYFGETATPVHAKLFGAVAGSTPDHAAEAKKIMGQPDKSLITKAAELTPEHIAALPSADKAALAKKLADIEPDLSPGLAKTAGDIHAKLVGPKTSPTTKKVPQHLVDAAATEAQKLNSTPIDHEKILTAHESVDWSKVNTAGHDSAAMDLHQILNNSTVPQAQKDRAKVLLSKINNTHAAPDKPGSIKAPAGTPNGKLTPTGQKLGTHGAEVAADVTGKKFLVKPHAPYGDFTSHGEVGASQLAKSVGLPTPEVHLTPDGTVQELVPGAKDAFPGKQFDPAKLSSQDVLDLQKHHVLDWLIGNHDAHPGNFLRDADGNLVEIDKGQAFKHYHEDKLSSEYHPNAVYGESPPVYNTLLKAAELGDVQLHSPAPGEPLGEFIKQVQAIPTAKIAQMFGPYAESRFNGNEEKVHTFLNQIVVRKKNLTSSFDQLYLGHVKSSELKISGPNHQTEAKKIMEQPNKSLLTKASELTPEHIAAMPKADKDNLAEKLASLQQDLISPTLKKTAGDLHAKLSGKTPASVLPAAPLPAGTPAHVQHAQSLATGATYGTAKAKLAAYEKLTAPEYHSLPHEVQVAIHMDLNEAHEKFVDPKKKAAVKAALSKLGAPGEAGAEVTAHQHAVAHDAVKQLTGTGPVAAPASVVQSWQNAKDGKAGGLGSSVDEQASTLSKNFAQTWAFKYLENEPFMASAFSPAEQKTIKTKVAAEMKDMLVKGLAEPPPNTILQVAKDGPNMNLAAKAEIFKHLAGIKSQPVSKPAGMKTSAGLGKGKSLAKISDGAKDKLLQAYKGQGADSYLKSPVEDNYAAVLAVAHAHHNKPGYGSLSLSQVIDSIDEASAKKAGLANSGALKQKISDWLATPEGKKYALKAKPDLTKVDQIAAGVVEPIKLIKPGKPGQLVKGNKLQKVGGPGGYKASETDFPALSHSQISAVQTEYQISAGAQWNAKQRQAIKEYTSSSYIEINGWLRDGGEPYGGQATIEHAHALQSAMLPLQQNAQFARGTDWSQFPPGFQDPTAVKKLVGKTIDDPGFISTATAGQSQGFQSKKVRLVIEAPKGTMGAYVEHHTSVSGEYEFILAAGTKFKVLKVAEDHYGKTVVTLRVVS